VRAPLHCGTVLLGTAALWLASSGRLEAAQAKKPPPPPKPPAKIAPPKPGNGNPNKQPAKPIPAEQLGRLLNMTPEQREKNLSKLPPPQRQRLENQLNNLDKMSPEQRAQRLDQISRLEKMPPARQQAVTKEMQSIQALPVPERRARLHSPEFNQTYSPEEQQLIRERFPGAAR
jgi:hypothetical protein